MSITESSQKEFYKARNNEVEFKKKHLSAEGVSMISGAGYNGFRLPEYNGVTNHNAYHNASQ